MKYSRNCSCWHKDTILVLYSLPAVLIAYCFCSKSPILQIPWIWWHAKLICLFFRLFHMLETCVILSSISLQVWTILDMHHPNLCSGLHWHFCDIYSTQAAEERMELWHKSGDLVCWSVLWLCPSCSSCIICNSQVLFSTIGPCPTVLSLWLLLICLYSSIGNVLFFSLTVTFCYSLSLYMPGT